MAHRRRDILVLILLGELSLLAALFIYQPLWGKFSGARPWKLGLDLAGGSLLVYEIDLRGVPEKDHDSVVRGLRDVIEKRVNLFGVSEPRVYTERVSGRDKLVVELAGIKDVGEAIKTIGATPILDFREVNVPDKESDSGVISGEGTSALFVPTDLTGRYVKSAALGFDQVSGKPQVQLEFTSEGAKLFGEITAKNVGKPLAIFLDNDLIEMPVVQEKIESGRAQISGKFTVQSAKELVSRFNAGALPAPITLVSQETVSAEFGSDALTKAMSAGALGIILVALFIMLAYRRLGVFAALALLMYISLTLAIFKLLPVTLTLAGIAGFILSIGMAVDANILVFERTKEERRKGLAMERAIEEGFHRAWTSIRDSNVSTLLSAVALYYFTSSFVRGFALTLFIGVVVSMFSAITITRTLLKVFLQRR